MDDGVTQELIPLDTIENIIKNDDIYRAFLQGIGEFEDINKSAYVEAINSYMSYAVIHSNDMTLQDFNRVNFINISTSYPVTYDFFEYLSRTKDLLNVEAFLKILNDADTFNMFMDFDNHKELFGGIDIEQYIDAFSKFIGYYKDKGLEFSSSQSRRISSIIQKYSLKLKREISLDGYEPKNEEDIDAELFKKVIEKIDMGKSAFFKARAVYIELAKLVTYDPTFLALDQNTSLKEANDIYNKSIADISLNNNKVVCKDWAELYAYILNLLGIKAVVSGKFHKYVTFDCDGTWMKADATNTVYTLDDTLSMPDITRIQAGLSTGGYVCLEADKDITELLKQVDDELEFKPTSLEDRYRELEERYLGLKVQEGSYDQKVFDSIDFLRKVSEDSTLENFELFKYIETLSRPLFEKNKINGVETKFICIKGEDGSYEASTLLAYLSTEAGYVYITLSKGSLNVISKEELIDKINSGEIKIVGRNKRIFGLEREILSGHTK